MGINKDARMQEDQWFMDQDRKLLVELKRRREERMRDENRQEEERKRDELREQHWMCCPKCGHSMEETDLSGIQVDICSRCEGVYFDRGELEDLLLRHQEKRRGRFRRLLGLGEAD